MNDFFQNKKKFNSRARDEHITFLHKDMYDILNSIKLNAQTNGININFPTASYWLAVEIKKRKITPEINFNIKFKKNKRGEVL